MGGVIDNVITDTYDIEQELTQTCTISKNTPGVVDTYNRPADSWADAYTLVACRLIDKRGKETVIDKQVVMADFLLFLKIGQDITEKDRVGIDINGVSQTLAVILVSDASSKSHHLEVACKLMR